MKKLLYILSFIFLFATFSCAKTLSTDEIAKINELAKNFNGFDKEISYIGKYKSNDRTVYTYATVQDLDDMYLIEDYFQEDNLIKFVYNKNTHDLSKNDEVISNLAITSSDMFMEECSKLINDNIEILSINFFTGLVKEEFVKSNLLPGGHGEETMYVTKEIDSRLYMKDDKFNDAMNFLSDGNYEKGMFLTFGIMLDNDLTKILPEFRFISAGEYTVYFENAVINQFMYLV